MRWLVLVGSVVALAAGCGRDACPEPASAPPPPALRPTFLAETLAIETVDDAAAALLGKGIRLPASRLETFSTADDGQATFQVALVVGDAPRASANRRLLSIAVPLRAGQPRAVPQIDVLVAVDARGRVTIDAGERGGPDRFHRDDLVVAVDER